MFERFTEAARRVIFHARFQTFVTRSAVIEPGHLLLGIYQDNVGALRALLPAELSVDSLREEMFGPTPAGGVSSSADLPLSPASKQILADAALEADALGARRIGCEHLLLALLRGAEAEPARILGKYGVDRDRVLRPRG